MRISIRQSLRNEFRVTADIDAESEWHGFFAGRVIFLCFGEGDRREHMGGMHKIRRKTLVRCTKVKKRENNSHSPLAILPEIIYDIDTSWGIMAIRHFCPPHEILCEV